jgi:hypothetical protein
MYTCMFDVYVYIFCTRAYFMYTCTFYPTFVSTSVTLLLKHYQIPLRHHPHLPNISCPFYMHELDPHTPQLLTFSQASFIHGHICTDNLIDLHEVSEHLSSRSRISLHARASLFRLAHLSSRSRIWASFLCTSLYRSDMRINCEHSETRQLIECCRSPLPA